MLAVLSLIKENYVKSVHDCSKGGIAVSLSEMCIFGNIGCEIDIEKLPSEKNLHPEKLLFSESHSRYLLVINKKNLSAVKELLLRKKIHFSLLGKFSGDQIKIKYRSKYLVKQNVDLAEKKYFSALEDVLTNG